MKIFTVLKVFIDTNILVYAKTTDDNDIKKHQKADLLLRNLEGNPIISSQVVSEFYSVLTRLSIDDAIIQYNLSLIMKICKLWPISENVIKKSWEIRNKYRYSIWDCMIISVALVSGCATLYSEDMHDEQIIEN